MKAWKQRKVNHYNFIKETSIIFNPLFPLFILSATSKFPTPESYVDVCRNSAEAFTSDVWVEHLLPLLKPPIDPTDSIRQRVLDGTTRQEKAELLFDWLIRKVDAHGKQAFFALLDAVRLTYPHVAEEFWNHLKTIAVTKVHSEMGKNCNYIFKGSLDETR